MTPFASAAHEAETGSRASEWWWQFHQLAVAGFLAGVLVPAWRVWGSIPGDSAIFGTGAIFGSGVILGSEAILGNGVMAGGGVTRTALRVATLVVVAVGVSLRLHVWFLSRYDPIGLQEQRPRAMPWIRAADAGFSLALIAGALLILPNQASIGALFLGLGICYAVVFLMIEPATIRAAFRER